MFDAVFMIIPEETKNTQKFRDGQVAWDEALQSLPAAAEDVVRGAKS